MTAPPLAAPRGAARASGCGDAGRPALDDVDPDDVRGTRLDHLPDVEDHLDVAQRPWVIAR